MDLTMIEWLSTIFFLTGAFIYTGKRQNQPKIRIYGFSFYIVGGLIFIALNLYYGSYAFSTTQIIFTVFDVRGIINCRREIKDGIRRSKESNT